MELKAIAALAAPAYLGMAYGAVMMTGVARGLNPLAIGFGLLAGGGMALPMAITLALTALAVKWLLPDAGLPVQIAAYAGGSLIAYGWVLARLDEGLRVIGGLIRDASDRQWHMIACMVAIAASLLLMWLIPDFGTRRAAA